MSRALLLKALFPIFAVTSFVACSSAEPGDSTRESTATTQQKVIKGTSSDPSQDAVVLLAYYDPSAGGFGACTGTLIAPNLVLTARHCVADTDHGAACDKDGSVLAGGAVRKTHKADALYVFTGKDRPNFYTGKVEEAGRGKKIIDDGATNLCNHDIALVLLQAPVKDAKLAQIRLDGDVTPGEVVTVVGWGVTEKTAEPKTRQQRTGVKIQEVGPADSFPAVSPNEFQVGESICSGDSGGPALDEETLAIVGVVSRGGNQTGPNQSDPAASCIAGNNLYTKISPFKDMILKAFEMAEAEPWIEGGPDPRLLKPNVACTEAAECRSNLCLGDPAQAGVNTCAQVCEADADCTEPGQKCVASGGSKVCRSPEPPKAVVKKTSCATSPGPTGSSAGLFLALGLVGIAVFRRRR
jgi:MYXO-CTERM domain-containing protein